MASPIWHRGRWRIRWIDAVGHRRSAVFDDHRVAQTELRRREVEAEEIRRGQRDPVPEDRTFNALADYWEEKRAVRKRSRKDDVSILRKHLRPAFGTRTLRDIGVEDGDDYLNDKIDGDGLSPKTVANHLTLLGTMLRVAAAFNLTFMINGAPRLVCNIAQGELANVTDTFTFEGGGLHWKGIVPATRLGP